MQLENLPPAPEALLARVFAPHTVRPCPFHTPPCIAPTTDVTLPYQGAPAPVSLWARAGRTDPVFAVFRTHDEVRFSFSKLSRVDHVLRTRRLPPLTPSIIGCKRPAPRLALAQCGTSARARARAARGAAARAPAFCLRPAPSPNSRPSPRAVLWKWWLRTRADRPPVRRADSAGRTGAPRACRAGALARMRAPTRK